jgi:SprT-like family
MTKPLILKLLLIIFGIVAVIIMVLISVKYFVSNSLETAPIEVVTNTNSANVSVNKPNTIWNNQVEKNSQLQAKADTFLNLFDNMPTVPFYLKDEPILKTGTNTERGLAYTICEPNNKPTIFIKKVFYQKANQKQLNNVVKHELVHAWFCRKGVQVGHDEQFRKKFESIDGFGN